VERGPEAESGVAGSDVGGVDREDGDWVTKDSSLELSPKVVIIGEGEGDEEGIILPNMPDGVVGVLGDVIRGSGERGNESESESGVARSGARRRDFSHELKELNRLEGHAHGLEVGIISDGNGLCRIE